MESAAVEANHLHIAWRDYDNDWGQDMLTRHILEDLRVESESASTTAATAATSAVTTAAATTAATTAGAAGAATTTASSSTYVQATLSISSSSTMANLPSGFAEAQGIAKNGALYVFGGFEGGWSYMSKKSYRLVHHFPTLLVILSPRNV
jgi:septal ring-binding cell division protein DamX